MYQNLQKNEVTSKYILISFVHGMNIQVFKSGKNVE